MSVSPSNPNDCTTCVLKPDPDDEGFCFMWANEPACECILHSPHPGKTTTIVAINNEACIGELQ
jgi:hypothetical protein